LGPSVYARHPTAKASDTPVARGLGTPPNHIFWDRTMLSLQRQLENILSYVSALAVAFMMLITVADVLVRYLTPFSVPGSYAFVSLSFVFVIYLGLSVAQRENSHIAIDVLYNQMTRGQRKVLQFLQLSVFGSFFAALTWYSAVTAWENYHLNDTILGAIQVVTWPARIMIPIGFLFLTLRMAVQLWDLVSKDELVEEHAETTTAEEEA
jgi:TRAP-type C4-dicarboxylate transport system permease small subunit